MTREEPMTVPGAIAKSAILVLIVVAVGAIAYMAAPVAMMPLLLVGTFGGFALAIATIFKPIWAPVTAPVYAVLEGAALGSISYLYEHEVVRGSYQGIVPQAILLTLGVLGAMLALYRYRIIRVTETFRMVVFGATAGIALTYLVTLVAGIFWRGAFDLAIYRPTPVGIGFSLFVVGLAAMNLAVDFDTTERAAQARLPKYMEWYTGFSLLVTIVWLYLEVLRLLSKLNGRR